MAWNSIVAICRTIWPIWKQDLKFQGVNKQQRKRYFLRPDILCQLKKDVTIYSTKIPYYHLIFISKIVNQINWILRLWWYSKDHEAKKGITWLLTLKLFNCSHYVRSSSHMKKIAFISRNILIKGFIYHASGFFTNHHEFMVKVRGLKLKWTWWPHETRNKISRAHWKSEKKNVEFPLIKVGKKSLN